MRPDSGIKFYGLKGIQDALKKLPTELQKTTEMVALRAGAKPILAAAKSNAKSSEDSGLLMESLGINVRKGRSGEFRHVYTARIGARKGFKKHLGTFATGKRAGRSRYQDPSKYDHLVELGTSHSAAKPFIRPAVESSKSEVLTEIAKGYDKGLARVIERLKKK